jgi:hypothetical protein
MTAAVPFLLTVGSGVLYHLALRGQSGHASPWGFLTAAYLFAGLLCASAWAIAGGSVAVVLDRRVAGGAVLLGLAAVGIELGYFLAYRAGWGLGQVSIVNAGLVAVVLALIGVTVAGESMSAQRAVGLAVALGGVWLLARG